MSLFQTFRRLLIGNATPSTESVQRQILNYLDGNGPSDAAVLYQRIDLSDYSSHPTMLIDQAAQILVNQGLISATRNGKPVDPVNAAGTYKAAIKRREE